MKTSYTPAQISTLETNYETMVEFHNDLTMDDMTQDNLDELVAMIKLICGEAYKAQGLEMPDLKPFDISELDNSMLYAMVGKLNESARDLLVIARTQREVA